MTSYCKYCDEEIEWKQNDDGKWIATEPGSDSYEPEWHECSGRSYDSEPQRKYCYKCEGEIYFSEENKSASGKFIPMDWETEQPHKCKKKGRSLDELFWDK